MWIFDSSFLSPRDVDRQLAELGLGLRRDQAWDFDISFLSPREAMYHPTLNPARSLNRSQSHESRTHECKSSTAGKTKGSDFFRIDGARAVSLVFHAHSGRQDS